MGADGSKQIIPYGAGGSLTRPIILDFGNKDRWDQCFISEARLEDGQPMKLKSIKYVLDKQGWLLAI